MRTKTGFNLREVCGQQIIVAEGKENIDFSNIIVLNESSAYLWRCIQDKESFTNEDLVELLMEEYEVDEDQARADVEKLIGQWKQYEMIID